MRDVSQIFKLLEEESNISEISRKLGIARSTVRDYKVKADGLKLSYEELSKLTTEELESKFSGKNKGRKPKDSSNIDLKEISKELLKKGVTKLLLYEEYYSKTAPGATVSYSGFCSRIREYKKSTRLDSKQVYKAGEKYFIDFSGLTVPIYSSGGHFLYKSQIYVATLGLSNYTYVEAVSSQSTEDFVAATVRALNYLGGIPESLVPDNLKAAVTKNSGYEVDLNRTYQELANYYNVAVVPARVRKPQDKAKVETAVKLIQQRILAAFRNEKFQSLSELNEVIKSLLDVFNRREMPSYGYSRKELFNSVEKPELRALPVTAYEMSVWKKAKVHPDYHVSIQDCYYSVPSVYRAKVVDVCIKDKLVEIYNKSERIAVHKRVKLAELLSPKEKLKYRFSTNPEHLPPSHKFVKDWSRQSVISLSKSVGEEMTDFVEGVFLKYEHQAQALRSLMGLTRLKDKYGVEMLKMASIIVSKQQIYSMSYLKEVLEGISKNEIKETKRIEPIPEHSNIRGSGYYNKH